MRDDELNITPGQRFATGCIATLRRGAVTVTRHFAGEGTNATRDVAAWCDAHEYKVVTLCTPQTIYRDLVGTRAIVSRSAPVGRSWFYAEPPVNQVAVPEAIMLAKVGRIDLLLGRHGN